MSEAKQLADIFRKDKRFMRIMEQLLKKYESYGEHKGKIVLKDATAEECEAINSFLTPKKFNIPPNLSFQVPEFEKALKNTPYPSATLKSVLEEYYHKPLFTTAENHQLRQDEFERFRNQLEEKFIGLPCSDWVKEIFSKKSSGYVAIYNEYKADSDSAAKLLVNVCRAVDSRFESDFEPVQLAVLGADITGDSHYFDADKAAGRLLLNAIAFYADTADIKNASDRQALYDFFSIETNSISGTAAAFGIRLFDENGKEHPGFAGFADLNEPVLISDIHMRTIRHIKSNNGIIYVVENPSVFSVLTNYTADSGCGLLCTFGQIKNVGLKLMDLFVKDGGIIYYAGDFDPEGLQIADRLITRYEPGKVIPWRMSPADYESIQKSSDTISDRRLHIMEQLQCQLLKQTAEKIMKTKKAAYQELLIDDMIKDIEKSIISCLCSN